MTKKYTKKQVSEQIKRFNKNFEEMEKFLDDMYINLNNDENVLKYYIQIVRSVMPIIKRKTNMIREAKTNKFSSKEEIVDKNYAIQYLIFLKNITIDSRDSMIALAQYFNANEQAALSHSSVVTSETLFEIYDKLNWLESNIDKKSTNKVCNCKLCQFSY